MSALNKLLTLVVILAFIVCIGLHGRGGLDDTAVQRTPLKQSSGPTSTHRGAADHVAKDVAETPKPRQRITAEGETDAILTTRNPGITPLRKPEDILQEIAPTDVLERRIPTCTMEECENATGDCWCTGNRGQPKMAAEDIPQIIFWTFDDFVDDARIATFEKLKLLSGERKNPNGCSVSATFFVNDEDYLPCNYTYVRQLYDAGHEIGVHSLTHGNIGRSKEDWRREMVGQRDRIHQEAGIPLAELQGIRAPFLAMGGDHQFGMMEENGFAWDSSVITGGFDDGHHWPFKVGEPFKECWNKRCPTFEKFSGFWEVPLGEWMAPDSKDKKRACPMADMCEDLFPVSKKDAESYLWKNFLAAYRGNRAPLPLGLHAFTFEEEFYEHGPAFLEALNDFLDKVTLLGDVYLVSISQLMAWVHNPRPLSGIQDFRPWQRSCKLPEI